MKETIRGLENQLHNVFTYLHSNPEISWDEYQTTQYIQNLFKDSPCRITTFDDSPGLVIEIGQGKPIVGLRADIDALWQEVDGEFRANHSCGHDAHMTIVIGVLQTSLKLGLPEKGTFRFIFQPAEEKGTGALSFVEKGIVDDLDFLYGMHLRPIEELRYKEFTPAIRHGAARFIEGTIHGEDAHGARPHLNANAVQVGAELIQHLNNIQINPMVPHSVKVTAFHAGAKSFNIIPGNATFAVDVRAQSNEIMQALTEKIQQIADMLATYHDIKIELETGADIAASVINQEAIGLMEEAIRASTDEDNLKPPVVTTGGDDFHFYTIQKPHLKATMLGIGCDLTPGLHHPHMSFKHEIIPESVEILLTAMLNTVAKEA